MESLKDFINRQINEGVYWGSDKFCFNWNSDTDTDIIQLCNPGIYVKSVYELEYFYFAYKFNEETDSRTRTKFIHDLKFNNSQEFIEERNKFIIQALNKLSRSINLYSYDLIVYPQSACDIVRKIIHEIYLRQLPGYSIASYMLVKNLPTNISFDWKSYETIVLGGAINGRPRYTDKQKEETKQKINEMMDHIHNLDYFSIAGDVRKSGLRSYIENFLVFENENAKKVFDGINNAKILIVDDIVTSGFTIRQILKTIACLRDPAKNNDITVFSLIG